MLGEGTLQARLTLAVRPLSPPDCQSLFKAMLPARMARLQVVPVALEASIGRFRAGGSVRREIVLASEQANRLRMPMRNQPTLPPELALFSCSQFA